MDAEEQNGVASFLVREEGDQRLQLRGGEHRSKRLGHGTRKLLESLCRVTARVEDLLTDRRCRATAADVIPRRANRATLAIELVAADAAFLAVECDRVDRRCHHRAGWRCSGALR